MFCPQCGSTQNDDLKFCKQCGSNLHALRKIMSSRDESDAKFDWNRTWVKEMFMSSEEAVRHKAEIDRLQGITPEVKRRNEIKAGVITASVGIGLMILLFVLMGGIIASGNVSDAAAAILSRIWVAGVIPLFVGAALIFNGMVVSKRRGEISAHETDTGTNEPVQLTTESYHPPAETNRLASGVPFSVTDETTQHLKENHPIPAKRAQKN